MSTAYEVGWAELENGALLSAAEESFDVLITTDQNLRHQQNLRGRRLAIVVLATASWPKTKTLTSRIAAAVNALQPGDPVEIDLE